MKMIIPTPQTCNVVPGKTTLVKHTLQWLPENTEYPPCAAAYAPLINGEQAFGAIARAIKQAQKSIDIITWGFQASMYFERHGNGKMIGELLEDAAKRGVEVRILVWYSNTGELIEPNIPGWRAIGSITDYSAPQKPTIVNYSGRKLEYETKEQFDYDLDWHWRASEGQIKNLVVSTREFSWLGESPSVTTRLAELPYPITNDSSATRNIALSLGPTHHQKMVLVDYMLPEKAVGFVMGHNMLSAYWDTDKHAYMPKKANTGRDGPSGWQDISSCVYGEVLVHLNDNFVKAWVKETNDKRIKEERSVMTRAFYPPTTQQLQTLRNRLLLPEVLKPVVGQICRTQPQYKAYDILKAYMESVKRARQYIYIENQYFRLPELAEQIKEAALKLLGDGRVPEQHGYLHLFVVTNSTEDPAVATGGYLTYKMLDALGRADRVPIYAQKDKGTKEPVRPQNIPGLKTHICTLVSPDSPADNWQPVYVHSKLMMVDDIFMIQGSANVNVRSMAFDSEIAIVLQDTDHSNIIPAMRNKLWSLHTGGLGVGNVPSDVFKQWGDIISENNERKKNKSNSPYASLIEFYDGSSKLSNKD